jgi:hypothetical protein
MLIGFDGKETWPRIWYRFRRMVDYGIEPYPMVYDRARKDLLCFQRWVIRGLYRTIPWREYKRSTKTEASVRGWELVYEAPAKLARAFLEARDRLWARDPGKSLTVRDVVAELPMDCQALLSDRLLAAVYATQLEPNPMTC